MLSLDTQCRLTEFLGECWHEYEQKETFGRFRLLYRGCSKCQEFNDLDRLDFSDWRVVGKLIESAGGTELGLIIVKAMEDCPWPGDIKLAICLAIDAYLVAKGEVK